MSTETAPSRPRWEMRFTAVASAVLSLLVLALSWGSWAYAPQSGPASVYGIYENEATYARMSAASQHAASLASSILIIAMVLVIVTVVLLMIWPRRFGFLMVAAVTPAALVVVWVTTRTDLATIANPN